MSMLDPFEAQAQHPDAWRRIEQDMEQMKQSTAGMFVPVAAEVVSEDGRQLLHVVTLTDFVGEGEEGYPNTMSFKASLAPF